MSLANIKSNGAKSGFTIVELLIVVIVIAILAAITIVSYNGITTRANASAAKSTAATLQKKLELYAASEDGAGAYPTALSTLTASGAQSKAYGLAAGAIKLGTPTKSTGKDTLQVKTCGNGVEISYFDYDTGSGLKPITVGNNDATCGTAWAS